MVDKRDEADKLIDELIAGKRRFSCRFAELLL